MSFQCRQKWFFLSVLLVITIFINPLSIEMISTSSANSIHSNQTSNAISIVGNENFNVTANEYGWTGSGTSIDPYYLELSITASNPIQVDIKDTSVYFVINNSLITGASSDGISFENVEHAVIANSTISGNEIGIHLVNSTHNTIINNKVTENQATAIVFQQSANNQIINNTLTMNGLSYLSPLDLSSHISGGILMNPSPHNNITGNIITDNLGVGILVRESNYNLIESNLIENNSDYGIHSKGSLYTQYKFNIISYNGYSPIDTRLNGLHLNSHISGGILMNPSHFNLLLNNTIHHNAGDGVYAHEIMGLQIYNNTIYNNENGVEFEKINDSILVGNHITANQVYGVRINQSDNVTLIANIITNNTLGDIFVESSTVLQTIISEQETPSPPLLNWLSYVLIGVILVLAVVLIRKYR